MIISSRLFHQEVYYESLWVFRDVTFHHFFSSIVGMRFAASQFLFNEDCGCQVKNNTKEVHEEGIRFFEDGKIREKNNEATTTGCELIEFEQFSQVHVSSMGLLETPEFKYKLPSRNAECILNFSNI